jgi:DNA-binding LytR/AlgR family response regulator
VLQSSAELDMLFSDVVMPGGISGVSLARTARELRPDLAVLLSSGFVGETAALADIEFPLLDKPYETATLASRIRGLIDGHRAPAETAGSAAAE